MTTLKKFALTVLLAAVVLAGAAAAQGALPAGLKQSTTVNYGGVNVNVEATWVTPDVAAALLPSGVGAWNPASGIVMLVHESTSGAALPSAVLGSGSVLAVEGLGAKPEIVGIVEASATDRVTLVRFAVSPEQAGLIALNVPGKGVLVWNTKECLGEH